MQTIAMIVFGILAGLISLRLACIGLRLGITVASPTGMLGKVPAGFVADNVGMWGVYGFIQNIDAALGYGYNTTTTSSQTPTASAAQIVAGIMNRPGAPAGAVTETTDTAVNIIAALPNTIPQDGTFQFIIRYINNALGQTVTWTAGAGVTVVGTATMATNTWRDFLVTVAPNPPGAAITPTVVFTNIGGGTL